MTSLIISCCLLARISALHTNFLRSKVISSVLANNANNEPDSKYSKSEVSKILMKDCQRAGIIPAVVIMISVISLAGFGCVLYYTFKNSGTLGIIILIVGPVFFVLQLASDIIANSSIFPNKKTSTSVLKNIKHIQAYNKQCYFENEYTKESNLQNEKNSLCGFFNLFVLSSKFLIFYIVWGVIAMYSASNVEDKNITFEEMLIGSFTLLFFFICLAAMFGFVMPNFPSCTESAFRIFSFIDRPQKESGSLESIKGFLEFKSVIFVYPNLPHFSLVDFSFTLHPNNKITIIGSNRVIPDLLLRHFNVTKGEILIDGKNINEYSIEAIRNTVAYASKDPVVFAGGLRNNIDLAKNFTDTEVEELAKRFEIRDVENWNFDDKKKISVARSVIKKPKILIIDEECEPVKGDWSLITLSSTFTQTDQEIVLIEQGFVIEKGSFKDLMKVPNGVYRNFYQSN